MGVLVSFIRLANLPEKVKKELEDPHSRYVERLILCDKRTTDESLIQRQNQCLRSHEKKKKEMASMANLAKLYVLPLTSLERIILPRLWMPRSILMQEILETPSRREIAYLPKIERKL
ncbi:uncharacterized protein LOC125476998 isoform X2 [Pyrus x bretschneideri]|nr:uncharacterized protein LOC125476998 isoform X2 [Pyrus x bretschneideri]